MFRYLIISLLFGLYTPALAAASADDFHILFGIVDSGADGKSITVTDRIPRSTENEFRFGLFVKHLRGESFHGTVIYTLPRLPNQIEGNLKLSGTDPRQVIEGMHAPFGRWLGELYFHESDPLGRWQVEVLVDGERVFHQRFQVVEPEGSQK